MILRLPTADALLPAEAASWTDFSAATGFALIQSPTPAPEPGGRGEDFGKAAPVGLVVLLLFFLAVALLARSMNKHLRRIPKSFDDPDKPPRE
jgi:hypothetical protein